MNLTVFSKDYYCRTKDNFWFQEIKQSIQAIVNEGYSLKDIEKEAKENNFFSAASANRSKEIWNAVNRRLSNATDSYMEFFVGQNVEEQKLLALILILAEDRVYFELMNDVIKEKIIAGDQELLDSQILGFIHDIQNADTKAAAWTDASIKKLRTNMKGILRDSGIVKYAGKKMLIIKPILTEQMKTFLETEGLSVMTKILAGER